MEPETIDRRTLVAYLLGNLSEPEREAIAERTFTDDELFEELQEVENDLISQFVRGRLTAKKHAQFESYLQVLPDGREKIAVAYALANITPTERAAAEAELFEQATSSAAAEQPGTQTTGWLQKLAAWLTQPIPALITATGLVALVVTLTWLLIRNHRLSQDHQQLLAQMQQRDAKQEQSLREAERRIADEQARSAQLEADLEREKQLREAQTPAQSPALSLPILSWPLSSLGLRGPGQSPETVKLDPKARTVALIIPVTGKQKYTGYEVELKTEDGRQIVWKDNQPSSPPIRRGENIIFYRPANDFSETGYKLTLTLISTRETKTRDYYFTVVKQ